MKIACIHQPPFLPWLGIIESLLVCDVFILFDDVQYEYGGLQNRNKIKTSSGAKWITVPVERGFGKLISEVTISPTHQWTKTLSTIEQSYSKAPYFEKHSSILPNLLAQDHTTLNELAIAGLQTIKTLCNSGCELVRSSSLSIRAQSRSARLTELCNQTGCSVLYAGSGAKHYHDPAVFARERVQFICSHFEKRHPIYPQQFMQHGFIPNLSFLDMLFNVGVDQMQEVLRLSGQQCIREQLSSAGSTITRSS